MVHDTVANGVVWQRFFAKAQAGSYYNWVHCSAGCNKTDFQRNLPNVYFVPPVSTQYCLDLVTPYVQLLRYALGSRTQSESTHEKFVLVSESTLPVKPYPVILETLMADDLSDFAIVESEYWPFSKFTPKYTLLVKADQWTVLNRRHAFKLVSKWEPGQSPSMRSIQVAEDNGSCLYRWQFIPPLLKGSCTDEEAVYQTICGALEVSFRHGTVLKRCEGTLDVMYPSFVPQGRHRTFVMWDEFDEYDKHPMDPVKLALKGDANSVISSSVASHPASFQQLSAEALATLRASKYLFARKFEEGACAPEDIDILVASDVVPPNLVVRPGSQVQTLDIQHDAAHDLPFRVIILHAEKSH